MRNACDSDSRCGLACDASARDAKSLAMWVERCKWKVHFTHKLCGVLDSVPPDYPRHQNDYMQLP